MIKILVLVNKMCKDCEKLSKTTVTEFDDKEANKLFLKLEKAIYKYQEQIMLDVLASYGLQKLQKTQEQTFFEDIAGLLQSIFLYGQKIGQGYVIKETKELQALASLDFSLTFDIEPTRAKDYADKKTGALISNIDSTTQAEVQTIVKQSFNEWWTQNKLSQVIYDSFGQFNAVRSKLIARQETALALGGGKYEQFIQSSVAYNSPGYKKAYSQQDGLVRPEHQANADAWRIQANEPFPGTGSDHEPFGYNCRCVVTYRVFLPDSL